MIIDTQQREDIISLARECEEYIRISRGVVDESVIEAYYQVCLIASRTDDRDLLLRCTNRAKELISKYCQDVHKKTFWEVEAAQSSRKGTYTIIERYYDVLKLESIYLFESFIFFMEKNRTYRKRFYLPRRATLYIVVRDLQALEDRVENRVFYGLSMPSRVGKSTICIFFLAWIAFKKPNSHSAMGGHSGVLAKGFYKELLNMILTPEYAFKELFDYAHPEYANKPFPTDKSSEDLTITLGDSDRFATITCRGIDGTWTGAVDISQDGYLYVDDLVRDREHSLSPQRMEATYQEYLNKMVDRKNDGARELMVGTLWNVLDPLERIRVKFETDNTYYFRRIPALNSKDESNFAYKVNGFSTKYYRDMRDRLALPEWMAKYQQQPFVREGLLFPQDELKYSDGIINEGTWAITAVCDPAFGGADSLSMPVKLKHLESGQQTVIDWVFKKGTQNITLPLVADAIIRNMITEVRIEKNSGGGLYADNLRKELERRKCFHCRIVTFNASNKISKMERIKAYSDYVKDNYYFLMENRFLQKKEEDDKVGIVRYRRSEMYNNAMTELCMITAEGKNAHDDSADSITNMAANDERMMKSTVIIQSPI